MAAVTVPITIDCRRGECLRLALDVLAYTRRVLDVPADEGRRQILHEQANLLAQRLIDTLEVRPARETRCA